MSSSDLPDDGAAPAAVCDGGDLDCGSGLLLIIRAAMAPLAAGAVLEVRSRERSVREDLPAWCRMVGHALLDVRDGEPGQLRYRLRKRVDDGALAADLQRAREHVWQTRVRWTGGMQAKVASRNHAFTVGQPASFDTEDAAPSAIEYLLGALGAALATGLAWRLSKRGTAVRALEGVVKGRAGDILVFLDVAADGDPGLRELAVTVWVDADVDQGQLDAVLQDTVRRCPVSRSLLAAVPVRVEGRLL
jgi:TusA-related sulfurtransferase/uncharacterized OsmC-like protein